MAQQFFIVKESTLPNLRMELVNNGRNKFAKAYFALQSATATFSMSDVNTGVKKIANAEAEIIEKEGVNCDLQYILQYKWKERDTKTPGTYKGEFTIKFDSDISIDGLTFPQGTLKVPISEELIISVIEGSIKKP